jgi:hypothetical protein
VKSFQRIFALGILGPVKLLCRHSSDCCLSPGHSDTTRFRPYSSIATGNRLDPAKRKKIQTLFRRLEPLTILICVQAFRDLICGELPHLQICMNDIPNPNTWDAQLLSYLLKCFSIWLSSTGGREFQINYSSNDLCYGSVWIMTCTVWLFVIDNWPHGTGHNPHKPITQNIAWIAYQALTTPWG